MQNFQLQKMYPQQQLQYLSGMLSGLPVSSSGQVSQIPGPNLLSQLGGAGLAAAGAYGLYNKMTAPSTASSLASLLGGKEGGQVKYKPTDGIVGLGMAKALNQ